MEGFIMRKLPGLATAMLAVFLGPLSSAPGMAQSQQSSDKLRLLEQKYQDEWRDAHGALSVSPPPALAGFLSSLPHPDSAPVYDALSSRNGLANLTKQYVTNPVTMEKIINTDVQLSDRRIPVRIYSPGSQSARNVLFFVHGGGHLSGSVEVYDPIARRLAQATGNTVVAVDYRRAPESPYPAGLNDTREVLLKVYDILDQQHIPWNKQLTLVGDSGGGAFSATIAGDLQTEKPGFISKLVLIYPSLDYTLSWPSVEENGKGKLLDHSKISWYFDQYFQRNEDRQALSPLYRPVTATFPPTLMFSGGLDPLRDEEFAFAARLKAADVAVKHVHLPEVVHAFLMIENLVPDQARTVYSDIGAFVGSSKH
ncbi:alpha/beta hydrolase [Brucella anthropi]|uniref:alpha/beta hydrolase n=1 Tax=Brucella anthropi TaxID=529 RepID=UPI002360DBF0|nr:alpha/beta hydrolase [Brucella anthropi]